MFGIVGEIAIEQNQLDKAAKQPETETVVMSSIKIAVYTCITQGYDSLKIPLSVDERLAYFCYTDTPQSVMPPWKFLPINLKGISPKDQNRYIKMHPHEFLPDYDITVYVDGSIQIVGDLHTLICTSMGSPEDVFFYQHPQRNCVFAEAAACAYYSHDWLWNIASQMRRYSREGYPVDNGLFEAGVIVGKNTAKLRLLMNTWWCEYRSGAKRDQLSLPFVAWRLGISLGSLGESDPRFGHRYFRFINHPIQRSLKLILRKHINRSITAFVTYDKLFGLTTPVRWK
jgi:hypothetical protein